jgi:prevent-host-death family protein
MRKMSASDFKAHCLGVLDEVARSGESVVILKRGRPVARLVPAPLTDDEYPQKRLIGTIEVVGDVVGPLLPPDAWEAEQGKVFPK